MTRAEKAQVREALESIGIAVGYARTARPEVGGRPERDLPRIELHARAAQITLTNLLEGKAA